MSRENYVNQLELKLALEVERYNQRRDSRKILTKKRGLSSIWTYELKCKSVPYKRHFFHLNLGPLYKYCLENFCSLEVPLDPRSESEKRWKNFQIFSGTLPNQF